MKTKKRFLGILLSLAPVLGLMPEMCLTAQAADSTVSDGNALKEALSASETGTVTLGADIQVDSMLTVNGTKTLDLNGYGIRMTGGSQRVFSVPNGASLTINDSDTTRTHAITLSDWRGTAVNNSTGTTSVTNGTGTAYI